MFSLDHESNVVTKPEVIQVIHVIRCYM